MNGKYAERKENTYVYDCKRSSSVPTKKAYIIKEHCTGDQNCGFCWFSAILVTMQN